MDKNNIKIQKLFEFYPQNNLSYISIKLDSETEISSQRNLNRFNNSKYDLEFLNSFISRQSTL